MSFRALGVAATPLVVAPIAFGVLAVASGFLPAAAASTLLVVALAAISVFWLRALRERAELRSALETEQNRARNLREQAWQNTLLSQLVEELRAVAGDDDRWHAAATALGRSLVASRVAAYEKDERGLFRLRAQFVAEGITPLEGGATLPSALVTDRDLQARIASSDLPLEEDTELRALAGPLPPRSLLVVPVKRAGRDSAAFAIHYCETPKVWTEGERRFVQRLAEHVSKALEEGTRWRRLVRAEELSSGLLRFAQALASVHDRSSVSEMAVAVGAPLLHARRCAVLVEDESGGFEVAAESGFGGAAPLSISALKPRLDQAVREQALVRSEAFDNSERFVLVPMFAGREPVGVLLLEYAFADDSVEAGAAQVVADLVAAGLENARAAERIAASEASYAALSESGPDLCVALDGRGAIREANPAACRALGFSRLELLGLRFESLLVGESAPCWRDRERELYRSGRLQDASLKLRSKDGRVVEVAANAVVASAGASRGCARIVMRDVSEVRKLEHQLRQSQKLELIGELAGGIAHDFNNVLGGILGYASLLRTYLKDRTVAAKYVETIERSAVRGAELTGRLLSASRNAPMRREPVNLNLVVEETLELLAHSFHKRIRIERRLDPEMPLMMADASQLQQIVLNLCVNARDAMPERGVLRVHTRLLDPGDEEKSVRKVQLTVEDTGVGMDSDTLARLFEPFFSTKGEEGTGLGLSVVYGIVQSLGGDVGVRSSPGRGARFDVILPCDLAEEGERYLDVDEPAMGRGELILIVDDEKVLRELGKDILEGHGYRVVTVASGEEALDFLDAPDRAVALVILDVVMPGMDGTETFRRLRERDRSLPVLLSSGLTAEESVVDILREGAAGFIPKPYGIGDLTRAVDFALRQKNETLVH